MDQKIRVICDLDGNAADFFALLFEHHYRNTGERATVAQMLSWNMKAHVEHGDKLIEAFYAPGFFRQLAPMPGAVRGLKCLVDAGVEPLIVSTPCTPHSAAEKMEWCAEHLPFISHKSVWIGHDKSEFHADVLMDDGPHNAEAYRARHPHALIVGIEHPYNAGCKAYDLLAKDWANPLDAWRQMIDFLDERLGLPGW